MDKQMIEEMAQCKNFNGYTCKSCGVKNACDRYILAEELYNAGYRKIPENAVVLTREEYEEFQVGKDFNYGVHCGENNMTAYYENIRLPEARKETAEKFAERLKEMAYQSTDWSHGVHPMVVEVDYIDEIAEEFTGDKV